MTQPEQRWPFGLNFQMFAPILPGATIRERIIACIGAALGIGLTFLICERIIGPGSHLPLIVAPMGATAVILFAIPTSPLAQPWPIIGGCTISAFIGIGVHYLVQDQVLAVAIAVSLAIAVMSVTRCLHPPGAAVAMTAIIGGPAITETGILYPFIPVALNALTLVLLGIGFHKLSGRPYPNYAAQNGLNDYGTSDPPTLSRAGFKQEDVDAALSALDETFDIDRHSLTRLLREVELQTISRSRGDLKCEDIMSRDIIKVHLGESADATEALLLKHNIRTLPVLDGEDRLVGTVGLRELAGATGVIDDVMSRAAVSSSTAPVMGLVPILTNGKMHAVIITDADEHVLGVITQTDLLAAFARAVP